MKTFLTLGLLVAISYVQAGLVPASTTLLRQSTTIAHPSAISYAQPIAYSVVPSVYSQPLLHNAYYANPVFSSGPLLAQQSIYAQYPGLVAQSPVLQYPFGPQGLVQVDQTGVPQVEGGAQIPPQQQPQPQPQPPQSAPQAPPQQSPILSGPSAGTAADDDTVSVEAA
ncbi:enhancer of mRNA-decapping protein 1 [Dendroctonus ponderosae]|uniref:DUF4794 domain-containing protein n=1 Tax=Dendroctonus ponderosae TaxID=77166 RepID=U4UHR5_DENPD|nr:enhancer of mRNA-decapping protein 1 [Dendroctonus ponderosae]ERL89415.1 hypothetical protein D910_06782 [Dendroctonus ponderosae]KAH1008382.1 hypothetical protein HUJ05_008937 [Dendroctonus ponderosae]